MDKGINFNAIKDMTVGELQKFEADYPNLFDLEDYLTEMKIDTEVERRIEESDGTAMGFMPTCMLPPGTKFKLVSGPRCAQDWVDSA